jgi:glutaredoxin 3
MTGCAAVRPTADIDRCAWIVRSRLRAEISPPLGLQILRKELYDFDKRDERGVMPEVRIYTARYCPYCASAKALLRRKGIVFAEIDIGGNWERRDEMIEQSNGRVTVPQIFVGPLHVGGHDELHALERAGKLDLLLKDTSSF